MPAPPGATGRGTYLLCLDRDFREVIRFEYDLTDYPWSWTRAIGTGAENFDTDPDGSIVRSGAYSVRDTGYERVVGIGLKTTATVSGSVSSVGRTYWTFVDGTLTDVVISWASRAWSSDMVCQPPQ